MQAIVDGHLVLAGKASWLSDSWSVPLSADVLAQVAAEEANGSTVVAIAWDGILRGTITVRDAVKSSSALAIGRLHALGLHPVLLTGDNAGAAEVVARGVGISDVHAGVTPQGKLDLIRDLQARGHIVAMGTGTDAAIAASDITIVSGDLLVVADAVRLARRTLAVIKGNLFWAFAYNVAAIPIAMLGLLNPLFAGAAMAFSSVFVVTNSLRLRRFAPAASSGAVR